MKITKIISLSRKLYFGGAQDEASSNKNNPLNEKSTSDNIKITNFKYTSNDIYGKKPLPNINTHGIFEDIDNLFSTDSVDDIKKRKRELAIEKAKEMMLPKQYYENYHYTDLAGIDDIISKVKRTIEFPVKFSKFFEQSNLKPNRNILLYGPPGCGKTTLARAIANETGCNLFVINGAELSSKFFGESERNLRDVFKAATMLSPAIIFIDECDALATQRGVSDNARLTNPITNQLLTLIDNLKKNNSQIFVIAATNYPDFVDSAFSRNGRMDLHIKMPIPNKESLKKILELKLGNAKLAKDVNIKQIINKCSKNEVTGADIEALIYDASLNALERMGTNSSENIELEKQDFTKAINQIFSAKSLK